MPSGVSTLRASLDLLHLVDGRVPMPPNITHIVVEIGCNGHKLLWDTPFPYSGIPGITAGRPLSEQQHVLLVSFEPLLDKYAFYLSIQKPHGRVRQHGDVLHSLLLSGIETPASIGWSVPGRAIVLPYAVGSPEGYADFHVARSDGCSSLLAIDTNEISDNIKRQRGEGGMFWRDLCGKEASSVRVPVMSLRTVLGWFAKSVALVKIDAQGYVASRRSDREPGCLEKGGAHCALVLCSVLCSP